MQVGGLMVRGWDVADERDDQTCERETAKQPDAAVAQPPRAHDYLIEDFM